MGTLYKQPVRSGFDDVWQDDSAAIVALTGIEAIAKKTGIPLKDVIAAMHVFELRRQNELYRANGDAWDEQIAGIGEILDRLCGALGDALQDRK